MVENQEIKKYINSIDFNNISIKFCKEFDRKSDTWNLTSHSHEYIEIMFLLNASITINTPYHSINSMTHDIIVHPVNVKHLEFMNDFPNNVTTQRIICIWVDAKSAYPLNDSFKLYDKDGAVFWLLKQICKEHKSKTPESEMIEKSYITAVFYHFIKCLKNEKNTSENIVDTIVNFINNNYSYDLSLNQMSQLVNITPSYLCRLFKQKINCTPIEYLKKVRIEAAKKILSTASAPCYLEDVISQIGYKDSRYFSKVFKSVTDLSPTEFRKIKYSEKNLAQKFAQNEIK